MHDEPSSHDTELTGLEAELAALAPAARIDRDRLMYAAGQSTATRRLHVTNRILTATNILFGGLLLMLAVPAWINEPLAGPASLPVGAPKLVEDDRRTSVEQAEAIAPDEHVDKSVALLDGPTNFRLLRLLSTNPNARLKEPTDRTVPRQIEYPSRERLYPHELLNQYLNEKQEQM